MVFISHSAAETMKIGQMLARSFKGGETVLAYGELGAGKTAFAKGIAKGLGILQIVNSPTFNIMKVYSGAELKLYHIDAYRLEDPASVSDIGFDEALANPDGVSYIEWPQYMSKSWFKDLSYLEVHIEEIDKSYRRIEIKEVKSI